MREASPVRMPQSAVEQPMPWRDCSLRGGGVRECRQAFWHGEQAFWDAPYPRERPPPDFLGRNSSRAEPEGEAGARGLGRLAVLSGVRAFPTRVKCASLVWHTMKAALKDGAGVVSTE